MTRSVIVLAGERKLPKWRSDVPRFWVTIGGEKLLDRTVRQLAELGAEARIYHDEYAFFCHAIAATRDDWRRRAVVLFGDVVWPAKVLAQILEDPQPLRIYGNYHDIFAMAFGPGHYAHVLEAMERTGRLAAANGGGAWAVYRALCGFSNLTRHAWDKEDIFLTVPSPGTPAGSGPHGYTADLDTVADYYTFLERHEWARDGENWPHNGAGGLRALCTGTGRCGTGFMGRWLTSIGIPTGHETIFGTGGLERAQRQRWNHPELDGDSSWLAAPFLGSKLVADALIVHVIRSPRRVISSALHLAAGREEALSGYDAFSTRHVPTLSHYERGPDWVAHRFVRWNELIERQGADRDMVTFYIDRQPMWELLGELQRRGLADDTVDLAQSFRARRYNSRGDPRLIGLSEIEDLQVQAEVVAFCERHGYEWGRGP